MVDVAIEEKSNVIPFRKPRTIKHTVVLFAHSDLATYIQCIKYLTEAISSRTEILLITNDDLQINALRQYAEINHIDWQAIKGEAGLFPTFELIMEKAKGEYICLLHDSVFVSKNFLTRLTHAYENFTTEYAIGPVGCVVPMLNSAPGRQNLAFPAEMNPAALNIIQEKIDEKIAAKPGDPQWTIVGTCTDACLFMHRTVFDKAGYPELAKLDPVSRGSEFATRLLSANYLTVLCGNAYCYQQIEVSKPEDFRDFPRLPIDPPPQKEENLAICYRIKVQTDLELESFKFSLLRSYQLADKIFILDEGSNIKVSQTLRNSIPEVWEKVVKYEKVFQPQDDRRSYNTLLEWAETNGCTWVLMLETLEMMDPLCTREYLQKLMRPINPMVLGYINTEYYYWDEDNKWRADGMWSKMGSIRMSRVLPGRRIGGFDLIASRNGYVPALPIENIRVAHFGLHCFELITPEQRKVQFEAAKHLDPKVNWNHFIDETGKTLFPFSSDTSVSVYMPLHNGGDKLLAWLDHVWSWADEIVIGNDRSQLSKEDHQILTTWGAKVVPCDMNMDYSRGRNQILEQCTQRFIFQLDVDERVDDPCLLFRMMQTEQEAWIFPIKNLQRFEKPTVITETARLFLNDPKFRYTRKLHETIDDSLIKSQCSVGSAPVHITHFGYQWMTDQSAFTKMQKYLEMNCAQMKEFPDDGGSYYNLSLHLLEDGFLDDALRLLTLSIFLTRGRLLPMTELAKCHLQKALQLFSGIARSPKQGYSSIPAKEYATEMTNYLTKVAPANQIIAKGHVRSFMETHPETRIWLGNHMVEMERKIFQAPTKKELNTSDDILVSGQES